MKKDKKEKRKITLGYIFSWTFGVIFTLMSVMYLFEGRILQGLIVGVLSLCLISPITNFISGKFDMEFSRGVKLLLAVIIILLISYWPENTKRNIFEDSSDFSVDTEDASRLEQLNAKDLLPKVGEISTEYKRATPSNETPKDFSESFVDSAAQTFSKGTLNERVTVYIIKFDKNGAEAYFNKERAAVLEEGGFTALNTGWSRGNCFGYKTEKEAYFISVDYTNLLCHKGPFYMLASAVSKSGDSDDHALDIMKVIFAK